jgi:hypothetical protein
MNPVGLTRAEEASQRATSAGPRVIVLPNPGDPGGRATLPPDGRVCGAAVRRAITWPDGDRTLVCADCALRLTQLAASHQSSLRVDPW